MQVVITDIGPLDAFYFGREDYIGRIFDCQETELWAHDPSLKGWSYGYGELDGETYGFHQFKYIPYPS